LRETETPTANPLAHPSADAICVGSAASPAGSYTDAVAGPIAETAVRCGVANLRRDVGSAIFFERVKNGPVLTGAVVYVPWRTALEAGETCGAVRVAPTRLP
jgi:hypothetical protein